MTGGFAPAERSLAWLDGAALIVASAALLVIVAVTVTAADGLAQPTIAAAFCCLTAVGETVRLRLPDERVQAPIGLAGALGYALLIGTGVIGGVEPAVHDIFQTVAVVSVGMLAGAMPHVLGGRASQLEGIARRVLVVAAVATAFRPLVLNDEISSRLSELPRAFVVATLAAVLLAWPLEALLAAGVRAGRHVGPFLPMFRDELIAYLGIGSAIASTGVLVALATREIGLWALPVVSIPLLLAQLAYRRYAAVRRTQNQTVRALSRSTEIGGYTGTGHARRVADLSLAVGHDLGLMEKRLRLLEHAALMHDLGQLSLPDPIPGGATVLLPPDDRRRLAELSAEVIRQTGVADEVAIIVEAQAEPYRRPHVPDDAEVPRESRIIKVVNAYDDLVASPAAEDDRLDALETLRLGMAYEYDPRVVASLARVLERFDRG